MIADPLLSAALRHWGARAVPFSDDAADQPCLTPAWQQNLALLQQTAALRSLMLLCGDNGVGKSALVAYWIASLEPKAYCPLVITQATLSGSGLLAVLLTKLGQKAGLHRSRNLARLEGALKELGRVTPVLILDDAQDYPPGSLEEVRLLLGLNLPRQPVFALVLVGDLYLQDTLRLAHHRSLYSRIGARAHLAPLDRPAVEAYLVHGLAQVGL
jgi:general secretion pathway protein A